MNVALLLRSKGSDVATVRPDTRMSTVVRQLRLKGVGALVVSEDERTVQGLISERHIVHALAAHGPDLLDQPVAEVMSRSVITCTPRDNVKQVMAMMTRHRERHIPVVESGHLCGLISIGDVVKSRLDEMELEANVLRERVIARG